MKTNQVFNNMFDDIDYHGYYYKVIDKLENGVTCIRVELLNEMTTIINNQLRIIKDSLHII